MPCRTLRVIDPLATDRRPTAKAITMVARAVMLRCILCGSRGVFRGWRMAERCPRCNLQFQREQGQFVGAVGMNTIVSFGAILITMVAGFVLTWPDPDTATILVPVLLVAVVVPAVFFPMSKGLWGVFELRSEALHPGDADPGPWSEPVEGPPATGTRVDGWVADE